MESAAVLRSFKCSAGTVSRVRSIHNRPSMVVVHNVSWPTLSKSHIQGFALGGKLVSYPAKQEEVVVSCATTSETTVATDSDGNHNGAVLSDSRPQGLLEKNYLRGATFPNGFEALVLQVCDETEVAELKLKVGDFEMHIKRDISATIAPTPVVSPPTPPHVSSSPIIESAPVSKPSAPPKSSMEKISPFANVSRKTTLLTLHIHGR